MPPKKSQQQQTEVGNEANTISGTVEDDAQPGTSFSVSPDSSLGTLTKMFESFIHIQMDRDKRQEKEAAKQEHNLSIILTHQITPLHLDLEATRAGRLPSQAQGVPVGEPKLHKLEDSDDIKHYLTTFERLAEVYNWPWQEWAVRLIPLLTGKALMVLRNYDINRETYRQKFRSYETPAEESPQELYIRLNWHLDKESWQEF
ncbi:hypothetical protein Q5P01_010663 [Channa striata]|uniref:Uncharacterized protein n=1 Tax=Channa striata TaxID=64152 RepID=A0AA88SUV9_CHASR|nr:hypothetical protein Q5P01_010663 [Channa striata]